MNGVLDYNAPPAPQSPLNGGANDFVPGAVALANKSVKDVSAGTTASSEKTSSTAADSIGDSEQGSGTPAANTDSATSGGTPNKVDKVLAGPGKKSFEYQPQAKGEAKVNMFTPSSSDLAERMRRDRASAGGSLSPVNSFKSKSPKGNSKGWRDYGKGKFFKGEGLESPTSNASPSGAYYNNGYGFFGAQTPMTSPENGMFAWRMSAARNSNSNSGSSPKGGSTKSKGTAAASESVFSSSPKGDRTPLSGSKNSLKEKLPVSPEDQAIFLQQQHMWAQSRHAAYVEQASNDFQNRQLRKWDAQVQAQMLRAARDGAPGLTPSNTTVKSATPASVMSAPPQTAPPPPPPSLATPVNVEIGIASFTAPWTQVGKMKSDFLMWYLGMCEKAALVGDYKAALEAHKEWGEMLKGLAEKQEIREQEELFSQKDAQSSKASADSKTEIWERERFVRDIMEKWRVMQEMEKQGNSKGKGGGAGATASNFDMPEFQHIFDNINFENLDSESASLEKLSADQIQ